MKNEPWIDRVYKENLETRKINFNLSHWQQAESMIIEQERQKKKKRFIFWMFAAGLIGLSSLGFYQLQKPLNTPVNPVNNVPDFRNGAIPEFPSRSPVELDGLDSTLANSTEKGISALPQNLDKKYITSADVPFHPSLTRRERKIKNISISNYSVSADQMQNDNSYLSSPYGMVETDKTKLQVTSGNLSDESIKQNKSNLIIAVARLNTSLNELAIPARSQEINVDQFCADPIKVKRYRSREIGIRTSLAQQTAPGSQSSASIDQAGLELFYNKKSGNHFFYGGSIGYLSNFNKDHYAQVLTEYMFTGFGSQINNYGIKPDWYQSMFLQLNTGIDFKKHSISVGGRSGMLFATKGKIDQIRFTDPSSSKVLNTAQISAFNQGWLQNDILNKVSFNAFVAYDYMVQNRVGVGIQLHRSFVSHYRPLQNGFIQNSLPKWNVGFRLSYLLK